ncbi:MAG: MotA/TolQ/ExbB proton channel family protein [Chitinophagales bacterium]|nr:MotA/TolQ/ExbB proton channel family protein [Chitinophagales bacterium]
MQKTSNNSGLFTGIVLVGSFIIAWLVYVFVLGNPNNFIDNNPNNAPKEGNFLGIVYKGGFIVPFLITMLLMVITVSIERFLTIGKAKGTGNVNQFVKKVQYNLSNNDVDAAEKECDRQKGSVANVIKSGLKKYREMMGERTMAKDQRLLAIQKDVEESTALELPMLERNLPVIATLAPLGTLTGLLGTVFGMIRAFAALAHAGAPDAVQLSTGISEALINTALGILTSSLAIIMYNVFTTRIDSLTYGIDEAGYSLQQNFASKNS